MISNKPIKVMVIDDSLVFRKYLIENLPKVQSRIEIIGYATDPIDAKKKLETLKPDVISLDIEMPRMTGLEFLKELLPVKPIPVILVSSLNVSVFDALSYGAVDFVRKPDMSQPNAKDAFVNSLGGKIVIASQAKVRVPASLWQPTKAAPVSGAARRPAGGVTPRPAAQTSTGAARPASGGGMAPAKPGGALSGTTLRLTTSNQLKLSNTVIALGASTGGTEATLEVLKQLPADIPGIVITQHMPKGFTQMYAERLNRLCKMEVREARDGDVIKRGLALIAPGGDLQMKVVKKGRDYVVECKPGAKVSGHRPSVDVLFRSVAETVRGSAVGIILTGMGQDGAEGLLQMRKAGAYTLGQDKESSVVYGMPMVAHSMGAVCLQASCTNIPNALIKHLNNF